MEHRNQNENMRSSKIASNLSRLQELSLQQTRNREVDLAQDPTTAFAQRAKNFPDDIKTPDPGKVESRPYRPESPVSSETSSQGFDLQLDFKDSIHILKFSPNTKTDTTIHFILDVVDDIEGQLEEVGRLKRWGHFREALEYFESNLKHHLDLPLVTIEYADLLLEQGAYQKLIQLRLEAPTKPKSIPVTGVHPLDLYRTHFDLIEKCARFAFESFALRDLDSNKINGCTWYFEERINERQDSHHTIGLEVPFDCSEIQIIRNQLKFLAKIEDRYRGGFLLPAMILQDWSNIYDDLLMSGRIWELCDLLNAMFHYFGPLETFTILYDADTTEAKLKDSIERLQQDWSMDEYDESSELAMLSIFVHMIHGFTPRNRYGIQKDIAACMKLCLQRAESHATKIQLHSPELKISRPYLQWIITRECFDRRSNCSPSYQEQREKHFDNAFGVAISEWYIPIYLPVGCRDKGWPAPDPEFPPNNALMWVLRTSRELEDYETESMCLRELICREFDPRSLFTQLDNLLKNTQGNNLAHLDSCISQYLLTSDDESHRQLIRELTKAMSLFKPAAEDDICIYLRRSALVVLNGLYLSVPEYHAECLENRNIMSFLDRRLFLSPKGTNIVGFTIPLNPNKTYSEAVKSNRIGIREEAILHEELSGLFRRLKRDGREEMDRLEAPERLDKVLQREFGECECPECVNAGKEAILVKTRQQAAEAGEDVSQARVARPRIEEHEIHPKSLNRKPTVTVFEEASPPSYANEQPHSPAQMTEMGRTSDDEARGLARIRNQAS